MYRLGAGDCCARGRFQPKDKAGLMNFEEEQFLEVTWHDSFEVLARHHELLLVSLVQEVVA